MSGDDHLSASQLATYGDECPRKWGFRKLDGLEEPSGAAADFGSRAHLQAEGYERFGIPLDLTTPEGECIFAGVHLLPKPGTPGMVVEGDMVLNAWGHLIIGRKDIEILPTPGGFIRPKVIDHKTTSNFGYALNEETITTNIQAVLYAADAMVKTGSDSCDLEWIYYKSKKPYKAFPVRATVTRAQITPTLERIKTLADEIQLIKSLGLKARDLPYNTKACHKYGRCPYYDPCGLTANERMHALMSQDLEAQKAAFLAKLNAKKATENGVNGIPMNPPPHAPQAPAMPAPPGLPAGAQLSPDGQSYWCPGMTTWAPVPAAAPAPPPAPPAPPAPPPPPPASPVYAPPPPPPPAPEAQPVAAPATPPKRRGRPPKAPPVPGAPAVASTEADAYETIGEGFLELAAALRNG